MYYNYRAHRKVKMTKLKYITCSQGGHTSSLAIVNSSCCLIIYAVFCCFFFICKLIDVTCLSIDLYQIWSDEHVFLHLRNYCEDSLQFCSVCVHIEIYWQSAILFCVCSHWNLLKHCHLANSVQCMDSLLLIISKLLPYYLQHACLQSALYSVHAGKVSFTGILVTRGSKKLTK
jgi:hypothetical protein